MSVQMDCVDRRVHYNSGGLRHSSSRLFSPIPAGHPVFVMDEDDADVALDARTEHQQPQLQQHRLSNSSRRSPQLSETLERAELAHSTPQKHTSFTTASTQEWEESRIPLSTTVISGAEMSSRGAMTNEDDDDDDDDDDLNDVDGGGESPLALQHPNASALSPVGSVIHLHHHHHHVHTRATTLIRVPTQASHEVGRHLTLGRFQPLAIPSPGHHVDGRDDESDVDDDDDELLPSLHSVRGRLPSVGGLEGPPLVDNIPSFSSSSDDEDENDEVSRKVRQRVVQFRCSPRSPSTTALCNSFLHDDSESPSDDVEARTSPPTSTNMANSPQRFSPKFLEMKQHKKSWGAVFFSAQSMSSNEEASDGI